MQLQFLLVNNIKIAYFEKNREAQNTIFFIHGNSVSKRSWRKQYNSAVLSAYRMVAIDLPAHGDSAAAEIHHYTLPGLAKLMFEAVQQLSGNKPFILAGISLSTNIVVEMLEYNLQPKGLLLAGPCIVGKDFPIAKFLKPDTHSIVVFIDEPDENSIRHYGAETSLSRDAEDLNLFVEDFKAVIKPFRSALAQSITLKDYNDEVVLLKEKNMPSLIIFGKEEAIIDPHYLDNISLPLWNDRIYKIEGASHLVNIDQPMLFNDLLKNFAEDIFK